MKTIITDVKAKLTQEASPNPKNQFTSEPQTPSLKNGAVSRIADLGSHGGQPKHQEAAAHILE